MTTEIGSKTSAMDNLPPELKNGICALLTDREDLSNLRLTCNDFATAGEQFMLKEVNLRHGPSSFSKLLESAKHPKFGGAHIETIIVDPSKVREESFRDWVEDAVEDWSSGLDSCYFKPDMIDFLKHIDPTGERNEAEVVDIVERCFRTELQVLWTGLCALESFQSDHPFNALIEESLPAIYQACPKIQHVVIGYDHHFTADRKKRITTQIKPKASTAALISIVNTAVQSGCRLQSITGLRLQVQIFQEEADFKAVEPALAGLTSLRLHTCIEEDSFGSWSVSPAISPRLDPALSRAATKLMELKIVGASDPSCFTQADVPRFFSLDRTISNTTWPHLGRVYLSGFVSTEQALVNFVLRHKDTLEFLGLGNAHLTEGTWESAFSLLAGKLPKLRHSNFAGNISSGKLQTSLPVWQPHAIRQPYGNVKFSLREKRFNSSAGEYVLSYTRVRRLRQLLHAQLLGSITSAELEEMENLRHEPAEAHVSGEGESNLLRLLMPIVVGGIDTRTGVMVYDHTEDDRLDGTRELDQYDDHFELSYRGVDYS